MTRISIALVGDRDDSVPAHRAIPLALRGAAKVLGDNDLVIAEWVSTEEIQSVDRLRDFAGIWCVPASPYKSMDGALRAIQHARTAGIPFLGTCGGFQHAVIEYARNVLGWADADHAETSPGAARAVIAPLSCALVEVAGRVNLIAGTRLAAAYGTGTATEEYRCRFGLNPEFRAALAATGTLRVAAEDDSGDVRAVELDGHPFFVATLFQPERAALRGEVVPLALEFVRACAASQSPRVD